MIDSHVFGVRQKFQTVTHMQLYGNEREVGKAIRGSGLSRDEVFVTTKLWDSEWGYRASTGAIQDRLAELDVDYIDLLLLHTPGNPRLRAETWTALEDAQSGVSFCSALHTKSVRLVILNQQMQAGHA